MNENTSYEDIYDIILSRFKDYDIVLMNEDEVADTLHDYLVSGISKFKICRVNLSDRDDDAETFNVKLSDEEKEILALYALLEYLDSTYIRTPNLLKVNLSSTDFNSYSPANMLDKLNDMHDMFRKEIDTLLSRYSWNGLMNIDKQNGKVDISSISFTIKK